MPGVAQVWLTQEELDALLRAAGSTNTRVNDRLWTNIAPKLKEARDSLGCPVRAPKDSGLMWLDYRDKAQAARPSAAELKVLSLRGT